MKKILKRLLVCLLMLLIAGTDFFADFETELVAARPKTVEEERKACKLKLRIVTENLRTANEKIKGFLYEFPNIVVFYHYLFPRV